MGMQATCDICDQDIDIKKDYIFDDSEHGDMTAHLDCFFNLSAKGNY